MKQVRRITSAERGKNITVVGTVSATGAFIPPMIIYPRVRMNPHYLLDLSLEQLQQQILLVGLIQIFLCSSSPTFLVCPT
jgi:hypothetical protein